MGCKAGVFWSGIHELFSEMTLSHHLDGGHDQCTSEFSLNFVKKRLQARSQSHCRFWSRLGSSGREADDIFTHKGR